MSLRENLDKILADVPTHVKVIAISKFQPAEKIQELYDSGYRIFGENKALELFDKHQHLPKDIEWHFIGHLQSNKIKQIIPFVHLIHGVDSFKLLKAIDKEAKQVNRIIHCLFQFHIAEEETKFGLSIDETIAMLNSSEFKSLQHIRISGVMGMATYTDDTNLVRNEFAHLKTIFGQLKSKYFPLDDEFREISMGMSGDYLIAVQEGSTMVRIGSTIFGERIYSLRT